MNQPYPQLAPPTSRRQLRFVDLIPFVHLCLWILAFVTRESCHLDPVLVCSPNLLRAANAWRRLAPFCSSVESLWLNNQKSGHM
jgi:hypothetical protein